MLTGCYIVIAKKLLFWTPETLILLSEALWEGSGYCDSLSSFSASPQPWFTLLYPSPF